VTAQRSYTRRGVATSTIAIVAFFVLVVLPRANVPLVDGDVWWHLRAGETVLDTGAVPRQDTWTIAGQGLPWISQDWLTNTGMAAIDRLFGAWGETVLSLVFAAVVMGAFLFLWNAIRRRAPQSGWLSRIVFLAAGLIVAGPIVGVRVQTLDQFFSAATLWVLWTYLARRRWIWLTGLPLIAVAWVNMHAGYPILFLLASAVIAGEVLDRLTRRTIESEPLPWASVGALALAILAAGAALVLNPNGVAMYGYPFATASIQAHRDFIFEWSRPDLTTFPGQVLFAFLLFVVVPTVWVARHRIRSSDALILIGVVALSLTAIRFVLLVGPIASAMAAIYLGPAIAGWRPTSGLATTLGRMAQPPRSALQARANLALAILVAIIGVGIAVARSAPSVQSSAIREAMPAAAVQWLEVHGGAHRIFNVYSWGGYIGREMPGALVYIDGRSDIYGNAIIQRYAAAVDLKSDPQKLLDDAMVDHVIFWPDSSLGAWLDDSSAWRRVYADNLAAIWERICPLGAICA
jgi:hypothetical protein